MLNREYCVMVRIQKISLLFVLLLVTAFVQAQEKIGDLYYQIDHEKGKAYVCPVPNTGDALPPYSGTIVIPATVTWPGTENIYSVDSISASAFEGSNLTSISIPAVFRGIGENAFKDCTMEKVYFSSFNDILGIAFENNGNPMARAEETWAGGVKIGPELEITQDVKANAFNGVTWLTKVTFTSRVTKIGQYAFCNCTNLEQIVSLGNISTIRQGAFQHCEKLSKIGDNNDIPAVIPATVTSVEKEAFNQCHALTEVDIKAPLVTLPEGMFQTCTSLKKVTLSSTTTTIGKSAFNGCTSLTSFPFQDNHIVEISESAFQGCGFKTLTLPTSLADPSPSGKAIGLNAFKDCNNLTDLTIPAVVSQFSIDNYAFASINNSYSLKYIYSDADIVPQATASSFGNNGENMPQLFCKEAKLNDYKGETPWSSFNPTKIAKYSITYVKDNNIENPVVVPNIQAGTTLSLIPLAVEDDWTTPHGWFIKNSDGEFENAPEVMPASNLVLYCYYTTTYAYGDLKYSLRSDTKEATILADESNKSLTGSLTIPSAVTYKSNDYEIIAIEDEAFKDAVNLTGVDLSGATNLTSIGKGIFEGCKNLASVTLPNTLTEISDNMFYKCAALTGLTIPTSVTKIGEKAFSESGIVEITLPASITDMGKSVFQACKSLKKVTFASGTPLVTLPDFTFESCVMLESFPTLPATVTTIGEKAFSYCQGLTEIKLDNIKTINSSAFWHCEHLKVITLPTISNMGDNAFNDCWSVEKITINTDNAPTVGNNPFYVKEGKINAILFVKDTINYQNAPWKLFKKVYPIDPTVIPSDEIEITLSPKSYTYDGNAKEPEVTVKWIIEEQDPLIIPAEEYTVSYSNNINAGTTATVTITDKAPGFYKIVESDTTFTINKADVVLGDLLEPKPAGKENLTYDDKALQLITAGRLKNNVTGTLEYSLDGKTFKEEIPTGTDANTYNVYYRVKGDDNHNDSKISDPLTVTIAPKELTSKELVITLSQDTYSYTGNEIKPGVTAVKYGDITFKEGVDYTVSYENNINAGTKETQPKVIITDKAGGNYVVSGSKAFTINKVDVVLNDLLETAPSAIALTFNGTAKAFNGTAQPLIKAGVLKDPQTGTLEYSQDGKTFSEEIPTGTDANTYKVYYRVMGDGNHNDSKNSDPLEVAIAPKELTSEELEITLSPSSYTYDGSEKKPDVTVKFGDTEFIKDKDFTVSYKNHKYVGTAEAQPTVVITDKNGGNYIVSGSKTFTIKPAASSLKNKPTARNNTYDGTDLALLNTDGKSDTGKLQYSLSKDEESFSETIPTGKNAGNYIVYYRVKGDANHSDSEIESVTATIAPREANALSLSQSSYTYDGGEIKPSVTVQWNNTTVPGSEYTVSYSNNKNAGIATVIVTDKEGGNFIVSARKTFTITQAPLTISANSYEIFEGEKLPEFTAKYDGFVKNETQAVLTSKPIFSCNATATSKPGDYTISVGGAKADNYKITHKSGKLTILALKFVSGGESSKDEDDPATYKIISTGKDVGTTPTVAIVDDKDVGGAFAIPEAVTYHNTNYKVTEINESAFENNKYLTEVSIPSSITSIGDKAFKGCSNLKSITVYITTPISLAVAGTRGEETSSDGTSVFDGVDKTTCILYVPEASVDLYKAAPVWMDFQNILPITETTGISVVNVTEGEPFDVYNLQGRKVKSRTTDLRGLPRGIYIINGKKVAVK